MKKMVISVKNEIVVEHEPSKLQILLYFFRIYICTVIVCVTVISVSVV